MSVTGKTEVAELVLERGIIFGDNASPKQSIYEQSITPNYLVGTTLVYSDGRKFKYARAGAVALTKQLMTQGSLDQAELNNEDQTASFPVIGETTIVVEIATGLTLVEKANELAGGTLVCASGTAIGDTYNIIGSNVGTTDTNLALIIDSPIRTTWTTSTQITIKESLWMNSIVQVEPATAMPTGVPNIAVDINYYYWAQVQGPCGLVLDATETVVVGDLVGAPATQTTDGAVGLWVTLTTPWGSAMSGETTDSTAIPIWLSLPY